MTLNYDCDFQSQTLPNHYMTGGNEAEGTCIRQILTNYFDP